MYQRLLQGNVTYIALLPGKYLDIVQELGQYPDMAREQRKYPDTAKEGGFQLSFDPPLLSLGYCNRTLIIYIVGLVTFTYGVKLLH